MTAYLHPITRRDLENLRKKVTDGLLPKSELDEFVRNIKERRRREIYGCSGFFCRLLKRLSRDRWLSPSEAERIFETAMRATSCGAWHVAAHSVHDFHDIMSFGVIKGDSPLNYLERIATIRDREKLKKETKMEEGRRRRDPTRNPLIFEMYLLVTIIKIKTMRYTRW